MATALTIAFTPTPIPTGQSVIVRATKQVSAGINFMPRSAFKQITVLAAAATSPANILSAYTAVYGSLIAGYRIFFEMEPVDAAGGLAGPIVKGSVIVG